jgi:plastocyanin
MTMRSYIFCTAFGIAVLATVIATPSKTPALWPPFRYLPMIPWDRPPMPYGAQYDPGSQSSRTDGRPPSNASYDKSYDKSREQTHESHAERGKRPASPAANAANAPAAKTIWLYDDFFSPDLVLVSAGETVLWENRGLNSHTVTSDDEVFESGRLDRNDSYRFTFTRPGTYKYHCRFHDKEMRGTITVK